MPSHANINFITINPSVQVPAMFELSVKIIKSSGTLQNFLITETQTKTPRDSVEILKRYKIVKM